MSFESLKGQLGKNPLSLIQLDLDLCANTYSQAPCTAGDLQNHILRTEEFETGWSLVNTTINDDNVIDPLGTITADRIEETAINALHTVNQSGAVIKSSDVYNMSLWVLTDERTNIRLEFTRKNNTEAGLSFDLVADTVFNNVGATSWNIETRQVASFTWKRCSFTFNALIGAAAGNFIIKLMDGTNESYLGVVGDGLWVWGAQVTNVKTNPDNTYYQVVTTTTNASGFECYNTFKTCQDTPNFVKTTKTISLCEQRDIPASLDAFPCIKSISYAPATLEHGGIGRRASVTITMRDFPHNDTGGFDQYLSTRATAATGTFFGRLLARNPFYVGRPLKLLEGFINDPFSLSDFRTREYIIDSFSRVSDTEVKIVAKDILKLADDGKVQVPTVSTGVLLSDIDENDTQITVSGSLASQYQTFTKISINDEVMDFTWSSDGIFPVTRTTAESHSEGDVVQALKTWTNVHPVDVIQEILQTFAGVPPAFLDNWTTEKNTTLAGALVNAIVPPTGAKKLLEEITEQFSISIWWDDLTQLVKLQGFSSSRSNTFAFIDEDHFLKERIKVMEQPQTRLTQYWVHYGIVSPIDDFGKAKNYHRAFIKIDTAAESAEEYGISQVEKIFSRWIDKDDFTQPNLVASTNLKRFRDGQTRFRFELDVRETLEIGDIGTLTTRHKQDETGADEVSRVQVVKKKPKVSSHSYEYEAVSYPEPPSTTPELVIDSDRINYNVFTELGNPTFVVDVVVSVLSGVTVSSDDADVPAFDTGALATGSTVTVLLDGDTVGMGGGGGRGSGATGLWDFENTQWLGFFVPAEQDGLTGGDAFNFQVDGTIDFTLGGNAWAGGGGGAGSRGNVSGTTASNGVVNGGHGGGGGRSFLASTGGLGGVARFAEIGSGTLNDGTPGGAGGSGGAGSGFGDAGDGGDYGDAGQNSTDATGGAGGFAVRENGNTVTLIGSDANNTKGTVG